MFHRNQISLLNDLVEEMIQSYRNNLYNMSTVCIKKKKTPPGQLEY